MDAGQERPLQGTSFSKEMSRRRWSGNLARGQAWRAASHPPAQPGQASTTVTMTRPVEFVPRQPVCRACSRAGQLGSAHTSLRWQATARRPAAGPTCTCPIELWHAMPRRTCATAVLASASHRACTSRQAPQPAMVRLRCSGLPDGSTAVEPANGHCSTPGWPPRKPQAPRLMDGCK